MHVYYVHVRTHDYYGEEYAPDDADQPHCDHVEELALEGDGEQAGEEGGDAGQEPGEHLALHAADGTAGGGAATGAPAGGGRRRCRVAVGLRRGLLLLLGILRGG